MTNFVLVPLHGGNSVPIDKAILFLGRGSECDVVLTDSRKVSRKHCCVAQIDHRIMVRDLGSTNGVRINDSLAGEETELPVGEVLWIGDLGFRLEQAGNQGLKTSPTAQQVPPPLPHRAGPSLEQRSHDLGDVPQAGRRRPRSSRNFPAQPAEASAGEGSVQLTGSDQIDPPE